MTSLVKTLLKTTALFSLFLSYEAVSAEQFKPIPDQYELDKVVIFSRHGLRSPLTAKGSELAKVTPYAWTDWSVEKGHLTHKGTILETYFGEYLNQWLTQQGLLTKALCESGEDIEVYTNSLQRTIATGQAMTAGAFAGCNVNIKHKMPIGEMDPVFNPIIRSDDPTFIKKALSKIELDKTHSQLEKAYTLLSDVIDYSHSEKCIEDKQCEFFNDRGKLRITKDKEPSVSGTMRLSKNVVDALLLQYYEGVPLDKIANHRIDSEQKWETLNQIKNDYQFMLRGDPFIASHLALPLFKYIQGDLNGNNKITVLVGHDSNIIALLSSLGVKHY